jgi:predicted transcriptional regulator
MFQNRGYFNDHTFGDLPLKFIRRIGSLAECEIVNGVMAILQRWKYIFLSSKEYIKEIISDYFEYQWNRAGVFDESKLSHEI